MYTLKAVEKRERGKALSPDGCALGDLVVGTAEGCRVGDALGVAVVGDTVVGANVNWPGPDVGTAVGAVEDGKS